jgi:glycosyltransferase involved in cell wall biosynthesis
MVKIAFVSDAAYPWNVGGVENLERIEADSLAKKHEVHFFSFRWKGMHSDFVENRIRYHTFHDIGKEKFYRHGRRSIREAMVFSLGILRIFRYRFDVVYANQFPVLHLPVLKIYCTLYRSRLIIDVHEVWERDYWTEYLGGFMGVFANAYSRFAMRLGEQYIANSSVTSTMLQKLGIEKSRINLFSPVIDDRLVEKSGYDKRDRSIVFAGRLIKEKRIDKWLAVFSKIRKRVKVKGIIIGEGPEERRIEGMVKRMGLSSSVELRRFYKEKSDLYKTIRESSLLLHMSEREGLGLIVLESIALGTPVLIPSYSPIPEDIRRLCFIGEESELPDIALKVLSGKMRQKGSRGIVERFYISKTGRFYDELFARMGIRD